MKCTIPEISWHNREPVLSVDIFPENRNFYRLASGGGDCHVLIWQMNITEIGAVNQEVISDLTRHQRAVNCVRWSNTGQYLASGDDDANIIVWQLKTDNIPLLEGDTGDKEIWIVYKVMRGHKEDVYDLCWSMDGMKILSGSVDNTAILWDVNKGKMDHILTDHKGFVQGVSWDPKNQIIATISTDRMCRIFDPFGKQIKARIYKGKLSVSEKHHLHDKEVKFFHDDTFKSFFRRLQFTPDGSLLVVPSGHLEADSCKSPLNATLIFTMDNFSSPAVILPLPHQSSTVVRCCPLLYQLHKDGPEPLINLPYRMVFAVGTDHDIILYDTQQPLPFARFQDIHYTRLTDLTWSYDGLLLVASSTDGFCSLITFEMDELGVPWEKVDSGGEENTLDISGCEELVVKDENVDTNNKEIGVEEKMKIQDDAKRESKKRPSFLEQWALQKPKKKRIDLEEHKPVSKMDDASDPPEKKDSTSEEVKKTDVSVNILIPRRISTENKDINTKQTSEIIKKESTTQPTKLETAKINILVPKRKPETSIPKTEEKINVLIPRRIEAKRVEPIATTSTAEASCSTQKQRNSKGSNKVKNRQNSEDSSDSESEALSKEEREELHKASENIREFFCRVPKKQGSSSDIKPIAVRRKPMESTSNIEENGSKNDNRAISVANKHTEAKVIEVRRKPRFLTPSQPKLVVQKHSDAQSIVVTREFTESNIDQKNDSEIVHSLSTDARPIAVKRKPTGTDKDQKTKSGTVHSLFTDARPIAVGITPTETDKDQKTKSGTVHSLFTDARPIAVGIKPTETKDKDQKTKSGTVHSLSTDARPIAVKRKPTEMDKDQKTNSGTVHSLSTDARPIAVGIKVTETKDKDQKTDSGTVHSLSTADKPIAVGIKATETKDKGQKTQSGTVHSLSTDARPIAVGIKPTETKDKDQKTKSGTVHSLSTDARPIAVKRKPTEMDKDQKTNSGTVHSLSTEARPIAVGIKATETKDKDQKTDSGTVHSLSTDARSIAVVRKPKDFKGETRPTENTKKVHRAVAKITVDHKKGLSNATRTVNTSSSEVICVDDSDDEEDKTTPKKSNSDPSKRSGKVPEDRPPKIKVASLVNTKKSSEKTPKKTNALLNFLQKSAGKKPKKKDDKDGAYIDISIEETEARDAWKCDSKRQEEQSNKSEGMLPTERTEPLDEDVTEDFCLQLEESQEACDEKKTESRPSEQCRLSENVGMPKTPKRVPLITLASPKSKVNKNK